MYKWISSKREKIWHSHRSSPSLDWVQPYDITQAGLGTKPIVTTPQLLFIVLELFTCTWFWPKTINSAAFSSKGKRISNSQMRIHKQTSKPGLHDPPILIFFHKLVGSFEVLLANYDILRTYKICMEKNINFQFVRKNKSCEIFPLYEPLIFSSNFF